MSSARDDVLARVRAALGPDPATTPVPRDYRTTSHLDDQAVVERFVEVVDDYRATVHRCAGDEAASVVAGILARAGTDRVVVPDGLPDDWIAALPDAVTLIRDAAASVAGLQESDVVVTNCAIAIAETGTIVLDASPDQGRRALTLLPDHHVCVVAADRIVATVPEALAVLEPTRPLTMISGPSATSDIELDRVEGVHGPRTLDVIVVADPAPSGA